MLEETIINQTIVEYYEAYFHPFEGLRTKSVKNEDAILLQDKANGKYEEYEQKWKSVMARSLTWNLLKIGSFLKR